MNIEQIRALVSKEQQAVDQLIIDSLHSDVALIEQIGHYIVNSGGKRLRPLIVLLSALAANYQRQQHIPLAAIIEFIHTATLLHDDVVDESTLRRGQETANAVWGDHSSVLVGDFLYSRAFQMMVKINNMQVMQLMADTTNTISEGEVLQLLNTHDPETTEQRYFDVIKCKTAILFSAAAQLGAIVNANDEKIINAFADYGLNLGIAYQLIDDVLDYSSDAKTIGKNIGDDLAEGKPTLPLIYAMQHGNQQQAQLISDAIKHGKIDELEKIQQVISQTDALQYTQKKAQYYSQKAIETLNIITDSDYKQALIDLSNIIIDRKN